MSLITESTSLLGSKKPETLKQTAPEQVAYMGPDIGSLLNGSLNGSNGSAPETAASAFQA